MYSVYDEITKLFNLPFASINQNDAIRTIRMAAQDSTHPLHKSAQDYSLYSIGIYDDTTGQYTNHNIPDLVIRVSQLKHENNIES